MRPHIESISTIESTDALVLSTFSDLEGRCRDVPSGTLALVTQTGKPAAIEMGSLDLENAAECHEPSRIDQLDAAVLNQMLPQHIRRIVLVEDVDETTLRHLGSVVGPERSLAHWSCERSTTAADYAEQDDADQVAERLRQLGYL